VGRIFGIQKREITGGWRKLNYEKLHNLYSSQNTIRVMISKKVRQAGRVASMMEMRNSYKFFFFRKTRREKDTTEN
jgi:hypothetical protein